MIVSGRATEQRGREGRGIDWAAASTASSMIAALLVAVVLAAVVFARHGTGEGSTGRALQITARWSFLLFWLAYAGGALARLFGPPLAGLARHGRDFGLAFGSAQLVHVGLVLWLSYIAARPGGTMLLFWIGILCVYLLALFSLPSLRNALGPRFWRAFRTAALEYIGLVFATDFILAPLNGLGKEPPSGLFTYLFFYGPFALMLVIGLGVRVASFSRQPDKGRAENLQRSRATVSGVGLLLFAAIGIGLSDLFHGLNALSVSVASIFVVAGIFNTWSSLR